MVRRRQRPAKDVSDNIVVGVTSNSTATQNAVKPSDAVAVAVAGASLLDDQYFASPKRKDCRLANENLKAADVAAIVYEEHRHKNSHNNHINRTDTNIKSKIANNAGRGKSDRGGISGRNIGVPLATRSQTRTIENFFKANASTKNEKAATNGLIEEENKSFSEQRDSQSPVMVLQQQHSPTPESFRDDDELSPIEFIHEDNEDHEPTPSPPRFVLNGEDTNDTEYSSNEAISSSSQPTNGFTNLADFQTHRSTLRDSHSSHSSTNTDNIFLQEPVLKLDIDKSLNQASSIKINKSFEVGAVFSSPPTNMSSCLLNGRFNQIVTLNGNSPTKRDSFGYECRTNGGTASNSAPLNGFLPDHDSSSCDSGVAFSANSLTMPNAGNSDGLSPSANSRRRKPATPHRILCPSPIKAMPRELVSKSMSSSGTRKASAAAFKDPMSPRKSQRQLTATTCKSRRRLNKDQAPYPKNSAAVVIPTDKQLETVIIDDDDNDIDEVVKHVALNVNDEEFENVANMPSNKSSDNCATNLVRLNGNTKSVLNSAKHPTAHQNTTNNHNSISNSISNSNNNNNAKHQITKTSASNTNTNSKGAKPKINTSSNASNNLTKSQQSLPFTANNGNREMTDYFPVRRSVRKTKTAVKEEMMRNLEKAVLEERADGLKIADFEGKGRGVIADTHFRRGEFVIEYIGDLISVQEAAEREKQYALDENAGCYMYYFKHKNQQYCIDATVDTGKFGRLVNHSRNGNLVTKVIVVKQRPHLVLLAKDDIQPGEELTYDYGDRSKESLLHHPWLAF